MVWLPWPRVLSTGGATVRRAEDVDSAALTYAEVKAIASGNPLVIEKATIDAEVMRLTRLKKQHAESFYQMRYRIRGRNDNAAVLGREIANIREDLCTRISTRGDNFAMRVKNETFTDRIKAGRAIIFLAAALKPFESTKRSAVSAGFQSRSKDSGIAQPFSSTANIATAQTLVTVPLEQ